MPEFCLTKLGIAREIPADKRSSYSRESAPSYLKPAIRFLLIQGRSEEIFTFGLLVSRKLANAQRQMLLDILETLPLEMPDPLNLKIKDYREEYISQNLESTQKKLMESLFAEADHVRKVELLFGVSITRRGILGKAIMQKKCENPGCKGKMPTAKANCGHYYCATCLENKIAMNKARNIASSEWFVCFCGRRLQISLLLELKIKMPEQVLS